MNTCIRFTQDTAGVQGILVMPSDLCVSADRAVSTANVRSKPFKKGVDLHHLFFC